MLLQEFLLVVFETLSTFKSRKWLNKKCIPVILVAVSKKGLYDDFFLFLASSGNVESIESRTQIYWMEVQGRNRYCQIFFGIRKVMLSRKLDASLYSEKKMKELVCETNKSRICEKKSYIHP